MSLFENNKNEVWRKVCSFSAAFFVIDCVVVLQHPKLTQGLSLKLVWPGFKWGVVAFLGVIAVEAAFGPQPNHPTKNPAVPKELLMDPDEVATVLCSLFVDGGYAGRTAQSEKASARGGGRWSRPQRALTLRLAARRE